MDNTILEKIKKFVWIINHGTFRDLEELEYLEKIIDATPGSEKIIKKCS